MNAVVLDTNVLIDFLERGGQSASVLGAFDRLFVPAAVDAEFRAGLDPATRQGLARAALLDDFLADASVDFLPAGRPESVQYALLHRHLERAGTPIPVHDVWIAAAALVRNLPLATFDRHFALVPLLRLLPFGF
ncbi:MAG: PIN domain-containing protein [Kiritimatiellae bacterium]|nr:PIN domain-containing protein [Kiritimatiellia bacterium]